MTSTMRWKLPRTGARLPWSRHRVLELRYDDHPSYVTAVLLDGEPLKVGYVSRLRDGGTVKINLSSGDGDHVLTLHRSIRLQEAGEVYESFDGQRLEPL